MVLVESTNPADTLQGGFVAYMATQGIGGIRWIDDYSPAHQALCHLPHDAGLGIEWMYL